MGVVGVCVLFCTIYRSARKYLGRLGKTGCGTGITDKLVKHDTDKLIKQHRH